MCFSATVSFTAGVVLYAAGAVTISKTKKKSQLPFAAIPLLFGIQQIIEGGVWLSFKYGMPFLNQITTYGFIFFAYILWPIFIPLSVGLLEENVNRKKILYLFRVIAVGVSAYILYFMVGHPIVSRILNECIAYTSPAYYEHGVILVGMYLLATCVSCLFSSHKIINAFGVLAAFFFAGTYYSYTTTFVSVWCFFAAVLSSVVYLYFKNGK